MNGNDQKRNLVFRAELLLLFVIGGIFAFILPYTCDDWIWGTDYAVEHYLSNWFEGYNGRYLGNLLIMALTRSHLLRVLFMAAAITLLVYLISRIIDRSWAFFMTVVLLLFMPREIFSQTFAWTAGFANYVTSAIPTLFLLYQAKPLLDEKTGTAVSAGENSKKELAAGILTGLVMFLGSLIMENITIYNVVLSAVLLILAFRKKRGKIRFGAALLGSILASGLMFSNSAYGLLGGSSEVTVTSRKIFAFSDILQNALASWQEMIYRNVFRNDTVLLAAFLVVLLLLHSRNRKTLGKKARIAGETSLCLFSAYVVWEILLKLIHDGEVLSGALLIIDSAVTVIALVCFILAVLLETACIGRMSWPLLLIFSEAVLAGPLFVVNPVSARCFLMPYVLLILLLASLLKCLPCVYSRETLKTVERAWGRLGFVLFMGEIAFYGFIYGSNHAADVKRLAYVEEQIRDGKSTVVLYELPYPSYQFVSTPYDEWSQSVSQYKAFYGINQDVKLRFESQENTFFGVALDQKNIIFQEDTPVKLKARAEAPYQKETKIRWTSSDRSVAVVDEKGVVTPLSYGSCVITASLEEYGYSASCSVKVPWFARSAEIIAEGRSDGVAVSWTEVQDATGYKLYCKRPGEDFEELAYIPEGTQLKYLDTEAPFGDFSYYYVFPVGNEDGVTVLGQKSEEYGFAVRLLPQVQNFVGSCSQQGEVTLRWDGIAEADGYQIQVKRGEDGYLAPLADVPAENGTSFLDQEAPADTVSFYWITPYKNGKSGEQILGDISKYIGVPVEG